MFLIGSISLLIIGIAVLGIVAVISDLLFFDGTRCAILGLGAICVSVIFLGAWGLFKVVQKQCRSDLTTAVIDGRTDKVRDYLEKNFDPSSVDPLGDPALSYAAAKGDHEILGLLLAHGADPNATNLAGKSPLHYAIENDDATSVDMMLKRGTVISIKSGFWACYPSPCAYAKKRGAENVCCVLSDLGYTSENKGLVEWYEPLQHWQTYGLILAIWGTLSLFFSWLLSIFAWNEMWEFRTERGWTRDRTRAHDYLLDFELEELLDKALGVWSLVTSRSAMLGLLFAILVSYFMVLSMSAFMIHWSWTAMLASLGIFALLFLERLIGEDRVLSMW